MKVLIVDDSVVFRSTISTALANIAEIEVVGTAANGKVALQKLDQIEIDLITLDMEMPDMNGIDTLKALRAKGSKVKVIVFSSQTTRGAEKALEALREGADDVVAKPEGDNFNFESAAQAVRSALLPKIIQFKDSRLTSLKNNINISEIARPTAADYAIREKVAIKSPNLKQNLNLVLPQAIVIACSTGGPSALEKIFANFRGPIRIPILITQHMPPVFTEILARRIQELTQIPTSEGKNGELIQKGHIYIAPGDFHMEVVSETGGQARILLHQQPLRNSVRPAADFMFESASKVYRRGLMGFVLTGMGEDGAAGAKVIRSEQGAIAIQNKESCVVFGMPGAVFDMDEYDAICDLETMTHHLKHMAQGI